MREVIRNFVPVFISRGVVQISAYIDALLASLLPTGAVTGLINAQLIYVLPVSLFGMSVSAAELPVMSSATGTAEEIQAALRGRIDSGLRHIAFFIVPSAAAFLAFGDLIAGALLQTGRFTHTDAQYVWGILAGSSVGLLASTMGRLYSSAYYALARYAHAAAIRRFARRAHDRAWIHLREAVAAMDRDRSALGRGGIDGVGRSRRMGGVRVVAARDARQIGSWRIGIRVRREALAGGGAGGAVGSAGRLLPFASHPIYGAIATLGPFGVVYLLIGATYRAGRAPVGDALTSSLRFRSRCRLPGYRRFENSPAPACS